MVNICCCCAIGALLPITCLVEAVVVGSNFILTNYAYVICFLGAVKLRQALHVLINDFYFCASNKEKSALNFTTLC